LGKGIREFLTGSLVLKNLDVFKALVNNTKVLKIFAFSNNHYAGHGPATAKLFMDLWNKRGSSSTNSANGATPKRAWV
jgi:hypothetical protein